MREVKVEVDGIPQLEDIQDPLAVKNEFRWDFALRYICRTKVEAAQVGYRQDETTCGATSNADALWMEAKKEAEGVGTGSPSTPADQRGTKQSNAVAQDGHDSGKDTDCNPGVDDDLPDNSHENNAIAKDHKCNECLKKFGTKRGLLIHFGAVHRRSNKPDLTCKTCRQKLSSLKNLTRHMKLHKPSRRYKCNICDKGFVEKTDLTRHTMEHTGQKPFQCTKCQTKFKRKGDMNRHNRRCQHLERVRANAPRCHPLPNKRKGAGNDLVLPTDFRCPKCPRTFTRKDNLRRHCLVQHPCGRKKAVFTCHHCRKTFSRKVNLIHHMKKHGAAPTKERCHYCQKKYCRRDVLILHLKAFHNKKDNGPA